MSQPIKVVVDVVVHVDIVTILMGFDTIEINLVLIHITGTGSKVEEKKENVWNSNLPDVTKSV